MKRAVFLDRDGTINAEKNYLHKPEDWEWIPGAVEAIRGFNELGFLVIVITNQAGIARNYFEAKDVEALHKYVDKLLNKENARIDAYYYCPHHPDFGDKIVCSCRKPEIGLILQAQKDFDIDLSSSFMIGDKATDIESGNRAGMTSILVATGYGSGECHKAAEGAILADNIYKAFEIVKNQLIEI